MSPLAPWRDPEKDILPLPGGSVVYWRVDRDAKKGGVAAVAKVWYRHDARLIANVPVLINDIVALDAFLAQAVGSHASERTLEAIVLAAREIALTIGRAEPPWRSRKDMPRTDPDAYECTPGPWRRDKEKHDGFSGPSFWRIKGTSLTGGLSGVADVYRKADAELVGIAPGILEEARQIRGH